jgi:hypothetical protein
VGAPWGTGGGAGRGGGVADGDPADGDRAARDPGSGEAGACALRGAWLGTEDRPLPPPSNTI